jgi:type IV secretory pathway ATPase VirB11/archaellum biosynthesis ATPase
MEKKQSRSLAYQLAKVIDHGSLSSISGGHQSMALQWCSHESLKASGTSIQSLDVAIDVVIDA